MLRHTLIALMLFPAAVAVAQPPQGPGTDQPPPPPPPRAAADGLHGPDRGPPPDLVQLTRDLKLDASQSDAFLRLMRERHQKAMALRDASDAQRRELNEESDRQIASLMNAQQFQQFKAWNDAHRPPAPR